MVLVKRLHCK